MTVTNFIVVFLADDRISEKIFNLRQLVRVCNELISVLVERDETQNLSMSYELLESQFPLESTEQLKLFEGNLKKSTEKKKQLVS